jgi:putative transposase
MFKGYCFLKVVILQAVYFKLTFSLSDRDVEELIVNQGSMRRSCNNTKMVYQFTSLIIDGLEKRKRMVVKAGGWMKLILK